MPAPLSFVGVDDGAWTDFVAGRADAGPFHHPAWARTIAATYGVEVGALLAPTLGLPVAVARGRSGTRWISLPFTDACPPLAGPDVDVAAALDAGRRAAGIVSVEVRAAVAGAAQTAVGYGHTLSLGTDADAVFRGFHKSRVQGPIQRADREGLVVRRGEERRDLTDVFYGLHLRTRRRLGVPVQPRRFFERLWTHVFEPGLGFVLTAWKGKAPVASAVFFAWNRQLVYKFSAGDRAYHTLGGGHAVLWESILWGCEHGYDSLDFGRTEHAHEGLRRFKLGWGAVEVPLVYSAIGAAPADGASRAAELVAPIIRRGPLWIGRVIGYLGYRRTI